MKRNRSLDDKVRNYLNRLFAGVGESQQLFDLKEELTINLKEKIRDYEKHGMGEEEAFKEAISSMGDLSGLVDDMREVGKDSAREAVYTSMAERISTAGLIVGILIILFGILTMAMLYFMEVPLVSVTGPGIFIVIGGAILTYSFLARETKNKYAMNKIRATLYALAVGLILFSLYTATSSGVATGEMFIAISSFMVFFIAGVGVFLGLIFTGSNRNK
ncbi:permease prefix domain 1-containing protein [Oceanobacillus halotolerans]|uniref:permease prefix domain 1-containing protein n=1 Tax=Oceanobacillus halotolerans TaxID=2663380 RepID=UPI0013DB94ED|nr:permease prefix domain 1-containing protein [Oceanobacillus halotolerans]